MRASIASWTALAARRRRRALAKASGFSAKRANAGAKRASSANASLAQNELVGEVRHHCFVPAASRRRDRCGGRSARRAPGSRTRRPARRPPRHNSEAPSRCRAARRRNADPIRVDRLARLSQAAGDVGRDRGDRAAVAARRLRRRRRLQHGFAFGGVGKTAPPEAPTRASEFRRDRSRSWAGGQVHMKLYSYWRSSSAHRVRIALHLKGIPFEYAEVNLLEGRQWEAEHRARSPMAKVPVLELDDGRCVTESLAIFEYLEELHPTPPLLPADRWLRARTRMLAEHDRPRASSRSRTGRSPSTFATSSTPTRNPGPATGSRRDCSPSSRRRRSPPAASASATTRPSPTCSWSRR